MTSFKQFLLEAKNKFDEGDYEGAVSDYTKAIELNPDDATAYFYLGNAKFKLSDYEGAIVTCPYNCYHFLS